MNLVPYIEDDMLFKYAASCAKSLTQLQPGTGRSDASRLRRSFRLCNQCHNILLRRYGDCARVPSACEWLMDNFYMLRREVPGTYTQLKNAPGQRCCRDGLMVSFMCRALLQSGGGKLTEQRCRVFLRGFQSEIVLQRSELMLIPTALCFVIFEAMAQLCRKLMASAAPESLSDDFSALFTSLRLLSSMDIETLLDEADVSGAILSKDPSGHYPGMDRRTKGTYLESLRRMAIREKLPEQELAEKLISRAVEENRHIGFYLFSPPGTIRQGVYICTLCLATAFLSLLIAFYFESPLSALLLALPLWSMLKGLMDCLLLHFIRPRALPAMDTEKSIPPEGKSICVISTILGGTDPMRLEELCLASRHQGKNLLFGLLADLPAAEQQRMPEDEKLISQARCAIEQLNRKYSGGFYLFFRERSYDGEGYSGKERKRGAITELAKLLCGRETELSVTGDMSALMGTKFIISLDADTRIYPGSVSRLIGAALHPLNLPVIDHKKKVVSSGHAIIHPRIETELQSACATDFALIFAGPGGSDPYGGLCTELYMDAFSNGGFAGKGLIQAEALLECTEERFPPGRILSHDAPEGAFLRGAYMSDTEFSDAFPSGPISYFKRQHRWIRGDWQNIPFMFSKALSPIDRFRLFDSLRRSLTAPLSLAAILIGFFSAAAGLRLAAWAALLSLLQNLFLSFAALPSRRRRLRRHSRLLSGAGGAIVRCFMQLWLLPYEAWVCISAVFSALWRMYVSRKKLLQWQPFSTGGGSSFSDHIRNMWPAVMLGVVLMAFSPEIIGKAAGFMWLLSPAAGAALALPAHKETDLSSPDRELLCGAVLEHWAYLKELSGPGDNFLPPDNFQQQPPVGTAHRTSPTNIGLALAAAASAADCGIIRKREAISYISAMLPTLEKMEKHRGHFFNWYDTATLRPLLPEHISTVDSGNLCAGLMCASAALTGWGRHDLAARLEKLCGDMDFSMLFDKHRELFYISYDSRENRGVGGWYDLMASEAMLTSYLALSRGNVPLRHWRRLSRAQLQKDGYRGLASWTGTMFEYLMPLLFLPLCRSSLLYESARFCVYAQRKRHFPGKPWGISESAFYSLDTGLNYRYKAHGVAELALKRGQEADMVISPYSSFLALSVAPAAAVRNLRRLKELGATGRWGFIEALDFTPGRCSRDEGEQVRCWMAHHVSMSILAAINALEKNHVQRLFMTSPAMNAHSLLLQEKLPENEGLIRRDRSIIPERPRQRLRRSFRLRGGSKDNEPRAALLSNGAYNLRIMNTGRSAAYSGEICIYDEEGPVLKLGGKGLLQWESLSMWELGDELCRWKWEEGPAAFSLSRYTAEGELGECMELEYSGLKTPAELELSFRPILAKPKDYSSHSAYWKLGIEAKLSDTGELLLRRLRKSDNKELWLCLCCSDAVSFSAGDKGIMGTLSEPYVKARLYLSSKGTAKRKLRFALSVDYSEKEALESARRILLSAPSARGSMCAAAAARLDMSSDEVGEAMALIPALWENRLSAPLAKRELWPFGISGDQPIICCDGGASERDFLIKAFCLIKSCGMEGELVFFSSEQGEYMQPLARRIGAALSQFGLDALMGSRGGVFIVPSTAREIVGSRAAVFIGEKYGSKPAMNVFGSGPERVPGPIPRFFCEDGHFEYIVKDSLAPRIWQHILTNSRLSAFAADFGPAGLWFENAREMSFISPPSDIHAVQGCESICVMLGDERLSLFAAQDSLSCHISYEPGLVTWEKQLGDRCIKSCMFIHPELDARIITVEGAEGLELVWEAQPHLGGEDNACLIAAESRDCVEFSNPESYYAGIKLLLCASGQTGLERDFSPAAVRFRLKAGKTCVLVCGCITAEQARRLTASEEAAEAMAQARGRWHSIARPIRLSRSNPALEHYINGWALYQTIACRLKGRSSIYQSGGALGFRDQLQDSVNLILADPAYARARILDCCRHQYAQGDVMHWWHPHPEGDKGVRTRCSDDLLWLVWAVCEYVERTGDDSLLYIREPFLLSAELSEDESDRYETPPASTEQASVLFHARMALDRSIAAGFGSHGLPMMGSGDWNDGMNQVFGESLWLAWFLAHCALRFSRLMKGLGEDGAGQYEAISEKVSRAAQACFNGHWYPRAYFPDGEAIADRDRIDSLSQSWAVFAPYRDDEHCHIALSSAVSKLWDKNKGIVKLLSPPYSAQERSVGYISGYGEGYRENGGQYTHGAIWLAMALNEMGRREEAWQMMMDLLPENHDAARYQAEPFVLAADVCSAPGREGQGGWSWYTGSAGWYFRAITESFLGLQLKKGKLYIRPALPQSVPVFTLRLELPSGKSYDISCDKGSVTVNGRHYDGEALEI